MGTINRIGVGLSYTGPLGYIAGGIDSLESIPELKNSGSALNCQRFLIVPFKITLFVPFLVCSLSLFRSVYLRFLNIVCIPKLAFVSSSHRPLLMLSLATFLIPFSFVLHSCLLLPHFSIQFLTLHFSGFSSNQACSNLLYVLCFFLSLYSIFPSLGAISSYLVVHIEY